MNKRVMMALKHLYNTLHLSPIKISLVFTLYKPMQILWSLAQAQFWHPRNFWYPLAKWFQPIRILVIFNSLQFLMLRVRSFRIQGLFFEEFLCRPIRWSYMPNLAVLSQFWPQCYNLNSFCKSINPFPNKPWFLRVCSTSLWKHCVKRRICL